VRLGWKVIRLLCGLFFAVTCFLGFIGLMIANLVLSDKLFPGIVENVDRLGGSKGASYLVFIISCPIPVAVCYVWYKLFHWIDKKLVQKIKGTFSDVTEIEGNGQG
jgi:hypothetical protein